MYQIKSGLKDWGRKMELLSMRNDCKFEKCFPFYFMLNFATLHKSLGPCHFLLRFVISYSTDNLSERPGLGGGGQIEWTWPWYLSITAIIVFLGGWGSGVAEVKVTYWVQSSTNSWPYHHPYPCKQLKVALGKHRFIDFTEQKSLRKFKPYVFFNFNEIKPRNLFVDLLKLLKINFLCLFELIMVDINL